MSKQDLTIIPHIVINPTSIVSYNEVISDKPRSRKTTQFIDVNRPVEEQTTFINSKRKSEGKVSVQAKRKISKAIEYLITTAHQKKVHEKITGKTVVFKCNFLTLTLPSKQIHSDKEIINTCLNSFLNECRKYHNLRNYVWRAELQKNGNIHFHIVTDVFIPWWDARNRWNRIVNKMGYVDRFHQLHGHRTPNSTDIHSTRRISNLKAYLMKYMSKDKKEDQANETTEEKARTQDGRIWGCNQELSKTRGLNLVVDSEIDEQMKKVLSSGKIRKYEGSYFTVWYVDYHYFLTTGAAILFRYFSEYLYERLHFEEQLTLRA